ncbi:hypothetical protein MLGJGCBP_03738 [Rhodococcus sp. T7]|nr:hypothetical protein MLGJGCBP_08883 [Rhodococcus sp. T7]KAF0958025.1 hypothetical protein MLGJGCBP_09857 [Rhodococcus sp. T7]KAF0961931.1 hypothetical protein MLGJGCBP_04950 [Rhodococcus sp. T7]KAF0963137.1 hypothetical protein MLGJGCBP_03738 [Rhodococcus sp. T7]
MVSVERTNSRGSKCGIRGPCPSVDTHGRMDCIFKQRIIFRAVPKTPPRCFAGALYWPLSPDACRS